MWSAWMQQQAPQYLPAPRLFSCSHIIRLAHQTSLVLCLPQADRKQNKIKQGRRKENRKKKKKKPDSQYFNTREDRGGAQEKRLENVLNLPLASGMVLLHITRLSPEQENILCPMATSKVDWIIRILGNSNSGDVKGTKSKEK